MIDADRAPLATQLRSLAKKLEQVDRDKGWTWFPSPGPEQDGLTLVKAGLVMISHGGLAESRAADWAANGWPERAEQAIVSSGTPADPTGQQATAERVPSLWEGRAGEMIMRRRLLAREAHQLHVDIARTFHVPVSDTRFTGQGMCQACTTRFCSGAENDRLKAGYCPACYTAWRTQGGGDRAQFEQTRGRKHSA